MKNLYFNARDSRWEVKDRYGSVIAYFYQGGLNLAAGKTGTMDALDVASLADLQNLKVGGGTTLNLMRKLSGTLTGIAAVGTTAVAVGTLTGMSGAGVAAGQCVFAVPKTDRSAGHVVLANCYVPTNNTVNVRLLNPRIDSAGSYPDTGVDVFVVGS